jgi:alkyldihydroxyacetonephosphate synthase
MRTKWYGWGREDVAYPLEGRPHFWPFLTDQIGELSPAPQQAVAEDRVSVRPSRLSDEFRAALAALVGEAAVSVEDGERLRHSYGKSYRDLLRLRRGEVTHPPEAVLYPGDHDQVAAVLAWARAHGVRVVPFGGGTSVVGGVEPGDDEAIWVTLDLSRLDQVLEVEEVSRTARIQAGVFGPDLERQLAKRGYLLGHAPQSFEFSTLGGWLATRSAGQQSGRYGKVEHMVVGVKLATPTGTVETPVVPAHAMGPDWLQLLVGSEGTLGVITEATMRIHPLPAVRDYRGYLFRTWTEGLTAARMLAQQGPVPATLRLSDVHETTALFKLREAAESGWSRLVQRVGRWILTRGGAIDLAGRCLMLVGYEGDAHEVVAAWEEARQRLKGHECLALGGGIGRSWFRSRFDLPYLRDTLMDRGVMVDTLETAGEWGRLEALYERVDRALREAIAQTTGKGYVMCHLSHAYPDGASLYFTFLARQDAGRELEQWQRIKSAATDAIVQERGSLSHHHGIGQDHAPWLSRAAGAWAIASLRALKAEWDPEGTLNPHLLALPTEGGR